MDPRLQALLLQFQKDHRVQTKGNLSTVVTLTRLFRSERHPIKPDQFRTEKAGQVRGLGGPALKQILNDHGIIQRLSSEGGRTSRGSMALMEHYIDLINGYRPSEEEMVQIEQWWIERVREFFEAKPYRITADPTVSLKTAFLNLFKLAERRQQENPGTMYLGALYQHLVAAKLSIVLRDGGIATNGFSVSDEQTDRPGDFAIGDSAIHVTTHPTDGLLEKCQDNIRRGLRPIIITSGEGRVFAESLARLAGIHDAVEIIELEQFMVTNIHEWSGFSSGIRKDKLNELVAKYNAMVDQHEGDPSMRIEI